MEYMLTIGIMVVFEKFLGHIISVVLYGNKMVVKGLIWVVLSKRRVCCRGKLSADR